MQHESHIQAQVLNYNSSTLEWLQWKATEMAEGLEHVKH